LTPKTFANFRLAIPCHLVSRRSALRRSALARRVPVRSAFLRSAPNRSASSRTALSKSAACKSAFRKFAEVRSANANSEPASFQPRISAKRKLARSRSAPYRSIPCRKASPQICSYQWDTIVMKLLERIDPPATPSLSLSRISNLPGLVVFLFNPILAFREIRYHSDQERQGPEVF
jgi:hypothetical protein